MRIKWAKHAHHRMLKFMRGMNANIYNDNLWLGRFTIQEHRILAIHAFEDGSGGYLVIEYKLFDKKTGKVKYVCCDNYNYHRLWWEMNTFIVEDVAVWQEHPRPTINTIDYRNR